MGDVQTTTSSTDNSTEKVKAHPNFVSFFQKKVRDSLEYLYKQSMTEYRVAALESDLLTVSHDKENSFLSLESQLCAWRDNPAWVDRPADIKVTIPKGTLSKLSLSVDVGLPPDAVYNIVTDPDNKRVFKNIKEVISRKVIVDEGSRQVVELEQAAMWRFLLWSGTISVNVLVDQNRDDYTMKFKQIKSGFMEKFEGSWTMEPLFVDEEMCGAIKPKSIKEYVSCTNGKGRIGSKLRLEQLIQPAIVVPPPISWYLRGITTKTTEMLINDLLAETARIRKYSGGGGRTDVITGEEEEEEGDAYNIKERWAVRRRNNPRHSHKRLAYV
ncbi:hypothetical protein ACP275_12G120000 [Erythranthe tilingii]